MNKTIRKVAVFGLLSVAAASCSKEPTFSPAAVVNVETLYYSSGGYINSVTLDSEKSWDEFLEQMLALARSGYEVTIFNSTNQNAASAKEVVTYTTTSSNDAVRWAKEMHNNGYTVTIGYDKETGIYTCTAVK